jgi:hypothetical protein
MPSTAEIDRLGLSQNRLRRIADADYRIGILMINGELTATDIRSRCLRFNAVQRMFNSSVANLWRPRLSAWRRTFLESGDEHIVGFDKADPCIY